MKVTKKSFAEIDCNKEGLVLLGCSNYDSWIEGVSGLMKDEKITETSNPDLLWEEAYVVTTTDNRNDIVLVFSDSAKFSMGRMAMWRLRFGDCSWISDYVVNYSNQHGGSR